MQTAQSAPDPASTTMLVTEIALFIISEPDDQVSAMIKDLELMLKGPCTPRPSPPETQPMGNCSKSVEVWLMSHDLWLIVTIISLFPFVIIFLDSFSCP